MTFTARLRRAGTCLLPVSAAAAALTLGSLTAPAAGALTSTRPPQPPPGGNLGSVSCLSASFCAAVGNPDGNGSLVLLWNGSTWQKQALPAGQDLLPMAVSCVSPDFCVAVGTNFTSVRTGTPLVLVWNGTTWAVHASPTIKGGGLNGVSCTSATACLAAGETEASPSGVLSSLVERWNGVHWFPVYVPEPENVSADLDAVSCSSAQACTAAGSYYDQNTRVHTPLLERWNGTRLIRQQSAQPASKDPSNIEGVSCPAASGCIAVGDIFNQPVAQKWNGTSWAEMTVPDTDGAQLRGVSCTAVTACTDVGYHLSKLLAERLKGTTWTVQSTPPPPSATGAGFQAVSCFLATSCVAVGQYGTGQYENLSLAERWNGTHWTVQPTPNIRAG